VAIPLRRRIAAVATCFVLAVASFGYLQRNASEAAFEIERNTNWCEVYEQNARENGERPKPCLNLY
jgi:hypothetical protein